jgi:hypothetical protein
MGRKYFRAVTVATAVAVVLPLSAGTAEWRGRRLPDVPTQFIFGYGSLINTASRTATAGAAVPAIPVGVAALLRLPPRLEQPLALGLRKSHLGETASTINGLLYPVDGDDMAKSDAREDG